MAQAQFACICWLVSNPLHVYCWPQRDGGKPFPASRELIETKSARQLPDLPLLGSDGRSAAFPRPGAVGSWLINHPQHRYPCTKTCPRRTPGPEILCGLAGATASLLAVVFRSNAQSMADSWTQPYAVRPGN